MAARTLFVDTDYESERDTNTTRNTQSRNTQSRNTQSRNTQSRNRRTTNAESENEGVLEGMQGTRTNGSASKKESKESQLQTPTAGEEGKNEEPGDDIKSNYQNNEDNASENRSESHLQNDDDKDYAYSFDDEDFESDDDIKTERFRRDGGKSSSKGVKIRNKEPSRRLPSARWRTLKVFDDEDEHKSKKSKKKSRNGKTGKTSSTNSKENLVKVHYMESSTESDEDDDRKLDGRVMAGDLTSEYWQIQKLIRFVKIGDQTATLIALCALNGFDLRSEVCQMALRDVKGLMVLTNMLRTDHDKCKIATLKLLHPLTDRSKYNRRQLVKFGAMQSLVDHIALSDNRQVVGMAATIIANMSQCSLARNILKQRDGIRKLVNLLDFWKNDQLQKAYPRRVSRSPDKEIRQQNLDVARSAARALWACCRASQRCRVAVLKTGGVLHLAKLVALDNEKILIPVTGLIQECCVDKSFRQAVQHTDIMEYIVSNLSRNNLELKTYGALAIFKCAEEEDTRYIVYEHDGILPIIDLLSLKERNVLAAATGAVWKCAQSEENARRFLFLDMMNILLKFIHPQHNEEWTEKVQAHAIGAISELLRVPEGCFELLRCDGCEALVGMLGHPNKDISSNIAKAIWICAVNNNCKMKFKEMEAIRLLWTLLKSFDDEVIINSAWALCVLIDNNSEDAEIIRSFVGGLEILVNLLKSENLEVLTCVCATISVIAVDYQNVGIISDYDVVPLLAELTNVKDNRLRRYLAEAIARCSVFGNNAAAFRNSGAVSKVVKYLYIEDPPLQEATVRALYQLSRDPANCAIMHEYGAVKLLLEMVGCEDQELQEAAAGCLANIRKLATASKNSKKSVKTKTP